MAKISKFKQNVINAVSLVPYGKVASYGQIALMVGVPRGARQVGWILNGLEADMFELCPNLPWWRIVNNQGRISIKGTKYNDALMQRKKLEEEGVLVDDDLTFDINLYRYVPTPEELQKIELDDEDIQKLVTNYLI